MANKNKKLKAGTKNDQEKPMLAFFPKEAMWESGKAFSAGYKKYGSWNYKNGIEITRTISAALRHIFQFLDGEDIDEETGSVHLGNAIAGLAMAIDTYYNHPELDNRHKGKSNDRKNKKAASKRPTAKVRKGRRRRR